MNGGNGGGRMRGETRRNGFWRRQVRRVGQRLRDEAHPASHAERVVSGLGGFLGILLVMLVSGRVLDLNGAAMMVASMGASAVLLFGVPHGPLSQPWQLVGGHFVSAIIGVTCARWIGDPLVAAPLAVGLAIGTMYYLRCIHPPGGATALVAVVGGPSVHALGYGYVVEPVMLNVLVIGAVAVLVNFPFRWRRYPQGLNRAPLPLPSPTPRMRRVREQCLIAHRDLIFALSELDSFIDVTEDDLLRIYELAVAHATESSGACVPAAATHDG